MKQPASPTTQSSPSVTTLWKRRDATARSLNEESRYWLRVWGFRVLATVSTLAGLYYIVWRYVSSLNLNALWFAIPLVLAETYGIVSNTLFAFTMWRPARRSSPSPFEGATVDVFITTYNEPVELVRKTAEAAKRIHWPHLKVCILDDGTRAAMEAAAQELGCDYITRGQEWWDKPYHAKAGNVNNAFLQATGDFVLILDADQMPHPQILERTIGYFEDPQVAFVQTPQHFYNIPPGDPYGSDAALFYGPIQQGKDGWNAAFFCGSNAILRREALMQLGLADYAAEMERRVWRGITQMQRDLARPRAATPSQRAALSSLRVALSEARQAFEENQPLETITDMVHQAVADVQRTTAVDDLAAIAEDLRAISWSEDQIPEQVGQYIEERLPDLAKGVAESVPSRFEAMGLDPDAAEDLNLSRTDEAFPVMVLPTYSITEDMATSMRLHAMGWKSVFHPEILAQGLAPEDLASALKQRLRWAQGTIQILLRDNPLRMKGLTLPQRLEYFSTIYSYFSGFSTLILVLSPIVYLFTGIAPVSTNYAAFLWHLVPFLVLNRLVFWYVTWRLPVWRGEQYAVALFPVWIRAVTNVLTGSKLKFAVTPKRRQEGIYLHLVWPQLLIICLTVLAIAYGLISYVTGWNVEVAAILIAVFWGCYNVLMLSVIVRAAIYKPPAGWTPHPRVSLFPSAAPAEQSEE